VKHKLSKVACIRSMDTLITVLGPVIKGKGVPLHVMEAHGGEEV
jgi:hypothetical protein